MKLIILSFLIALLISGFVKSQEVVRTNFLKPIHLKIVQAYPDSFDTISLHNNNRREMTLVCKGNRFMGEEKKSFIEYRNFYNNVSGQFYFSDDRTCMDLKKFLEKVHPAINEDRPLKIELSRQAESVVKIIYPSIDPHLEHGDMQDLLPKKRTLDFYPNDGMTLLK